MTKQRSEDFQRNERLEMLLTSLNADLQPSELEIQKNYANSTMKFPLILVMGPLRSGTTLFTQWLANTGVVSYPSNLLSRFYKAPLIGAKIQLLLTDKAYNFRDELGEFLQSTEYKSENGKTRGVLAPNEFWYFWRQFLSDPQRDVWTDDELQKTMNIASMKAAICGLVDIYQKPFLSKGMLFNYNIPFLDKVFEKILFVQIKRDHATNISSIIDARKRQYGSENEWYSFKIPEYGQLRNKEPYTQAAGQLHYTNKAVTEGMKQIKESRKMLVQYENFCQNPEAVFSELVEKLALKDISYSGPKKFKITRNNAGVSQREIKGAMGMFENL